jgi:hypothetical protein
MKKNSKYYDFTCFDEDAINHILGAFAFLTYEQQTLIDLFYNIIEFAVYKLHNCTLKT